MRNFTDIDLDELINSLRGSSDSLDNALNRLFDKEFDSMSIDDSLYLDSQIFQCETCGWWCDICEMSENENDDWICEDCQ